MGLRKGSRQITVRHDQRGKGGKRPVRKTDFLRDRGNDLATWIYGAIVPGMTGNRLTCVHLARRDNSDRSLGNDMGAAAIPRRMRSALIHADHEAIVGVARKPLMYVAGAKKASAAMAVAD